MNATYRPSPLIDGAPLARLPWPRALVRLTRSVWRVARSWTNTSDRPLVSPDTRFLAADSKATYRPSALIDGAKLAASPDAPAEDTLTRWVVPATRSWTNTSGTWLKSPATRLAASLANAT